VPRNLTNIKIFLEENLIYFNDADNLSEFTSKKFKMSINGSDRSELRVGDEPPFGLAIWRWEKHIGRHGMTKVLALIWLSAARKSPPVLRLRNVCKSRLK
jgi:hypothetical protein